jgi:hypothetical protein
MNSIDKANILERQAKLAYISDSLINAKTNLIRFGLVDLSTKTDEVIKDLNLEIDRLGI